MEGFLSRYLLVPLNPLSASAARPMYIYILVIYIYTGPIESFVGYYRPCGIYIYIYKRRDSMFTLCPLSSISDERQPSLKYLGFQVARPKAPLLLDAVHRVHSMRAADGGGGCLGEAYVFGLACVDYSLHARHHLLDCDAISKRAAAQHDDVQVV